MENASVLNSSLSDMNVTGTAYTPYTPQDWGPKRDSLRIVIPITTLYIIIFILGILGNVSTCIVIAKNKYMHTATNYYLFSLAISDLVLLISGLPQEIYLVWSRYPYIFGETFCIIRGFAAEISANASILTITAFTVERYVAICHPFRAHSLSKLSRALKFIYVIWLIAILMAIPQAMQFGVVYEVLPSGEKVEEHAMCSIKRVIVHHAFEISAFLMFVTPMTIITVLYVLIGIRLRRSNVMTSRNNSSCGASMSHSERETRKEGKKTQSQIAARKAVVNMLVAVVIAFFICWAPFHTQRLFSVYGDSPGTEPSALMVKIYHVLTYISGVLYYVSAMINPILYHIMSHRFREAFKDTLLGSCRRSTQKDNRFYTSLAMSVRGPVTETESSYVREDSLCVELMKSPSSIRSSPHSVRFLLNKNEGRMTENNGKLCANIGGAISDETAADFSESRERQYSPELRYAKHPRIKMLCSFTKGKIPKFQISDMNNIDGSSDTVNERKASRSSNNNDSVRSSHSISNSSLQVTDDNEFCSEELSKYMEELNNDGKI